MRFRRNLNILFHILRLLVRSSVNSKHIKLTPKIYISKQIKALINVRALGNFLCISYCFNTARQVARKLPFLRVPLKNLESFHILTIIITLSLNGRSSSKIYFSLSFLGFKQMRLLQLSGIPWILKITVMIFSVKHSYERPLQPLQQREQASDKSNTLASISERNWK